MSIAGSRGNPVITLRNLSDEQIKELDLGDIAMNGQTVTFKLFNNFDGLKGIPKASEVRLVLKASPKKGHTILLTDTLAVRGKCTFSAKTQGDPGDSFSAFPIEGSNFDEIGSGQYNQYQIELNGTQLANYQKDILNGNEWKIYIVVESISGGLELVQP